MHCGLRKIDKALTGLVKSALKSGRWEQKVGRKHLKLVLRNTPSLWVTVAGSSCDPNHAAKNLTADIRRCERDAGYTEYSV